VSFAKYQEATRTTAIYPEAMTGGVMALAYVSLGLAGEAGEIANKVKKVLRDDAGQVSPEKRGDIIKEIGDVLWYLARTADELGVNLEDIADANIAKLTDRKERGVLQGSGDNR
jgi:NTP pyrophosphatase (non-canonical NTP hydrolase)